MSELGHPIILRIDLKKKKGIAAEIKFGSYMIWASFMNSMDLCRNSVGLELE